MKKEEYIKRYSEAAYEKHLQQCRDLTAQWRKVNPEKVLAHHQDKFRKGGKYYEKHLEDEHTGLRGERNRIRSKHRTQYHHYKRIIAPNSQIHHEWIPKTTKYHGIALVEKDQHIHGFVDVIKILDGKISLLTEEEIRGM